MRPIVLRVIVLGEPSVGAGVEAPSGGSDIDEAELKRRTDFLKAQRDKLLAMKKEERDKQLAEAEKQQMKSRPKSARAARSAFGERNILVYFYRTVRLF